MAELAIRRARDPKLRGCAREVRARVLMAAGRYEEAREESMRAQSGQRAAGPGCFASNIEFYCGQLDRATSLAQEELRQNIRAVGPRCLAVHALCLKGEFDAALLLLDGEIEDMLELYKPEQLLSIRSTPEGESLLQKWRNSHQEIVGPAIAIYGGIVHLNAGRYQAAFDALEQVKPFLGDNLVVRVNYHQLCAWADAGLGLVEKADEHLTQMWKLARRLANPQHQHECYQAAGIVHLLLGRLDAAERDLAEAERMTIHPIDRHETAFWLARCHEAQGRAGEAIARYESVVDDGFGTWLQREAETALARLRAAASA